VLYKIHPFIYKICHIIDNEILMNFLYIHIKIYVIIQKFDEDYVNEYCQILLSYTSENSNVNKKLYVCEYLKDIFITNATEKTNVKLIIHLNFNYFLFFIYNKKKYCFLKF